MASVTIKVEGLRELGEKMRGLSADVNKKIARATTNAGAQVIKKIAIRHAPVSPPEVTPGIPPGNLKKNIIVRYKGKRSRMTSEHVVTVRAKGAKVVGEPYRVGIFQEYGTVNHGPQPFMRPALDQGKGQALEAMKKRLSERIAKANRGGR